jgi:hypothetical protein
MKVLVDHGKIFTGVWWLMGLESFCAAIKRDPDLVARMYEKVGATQYRILDIATDFDCVGGVRFADDLAYAEGLMVSPAHLRKHFFPWLRACVELVHRKGKVFIEHTDGDVSLVLEDIIAAGVDGLHPIEPKAMDIVELKRTIGHRIALCGNIDLGYTLTRGTPEEASRVKERIRVVGSRVRAREPNSIRSTFLRLPRDAPGASRTLSHRGDAGRAGAQAFARAQRDSVIDLARSSRRSLTAAGEAQWSSPGGRSPPCARMPLQGGLPPWRRSVGRCRPVFFIPEVLMSARTMSLRSAPLIVEGPGHEASREGHLARSPATSTTWEELVCLMLEGAGFEIIDLGNDCASDKVVAAVREHRPDVVALSAMLTTTMLNMRHVVDALKAAGLRDRVHVMVGGAPVDAKFAQEIDADFYAEDAPGGSAYARRQVGAVRGDS